MSAEMRIGFRACCRFCIAAPYRCKGASKLAQSKAPAIFETGVEMPECNWINDFPNSVTICDLHGIILEMNSKAAETYREYGGRELVGKSLLDCHPEPARSKLMKLLESGEQNVYTIEKNGIKKLIYQALWYRDGRRCGAVELALEIPLNLPHFIR
jgi:hypothetical protein